jgi:hypothetical protein
MKTRDLSKPYDQSTLGIPHHPKKRTFAVVPGLVRISNRVLWVSGWGYCYAEGAGWEVGVYNTAGLFSRGWGH